MSIPEDSLTPFILSDSLWQKMLEHILACLPEEACGLLGGRREGALDDPAPAFTAEAVLPIENELHSPVRFRMAPAEQLKAFYWLEEHGLELAAIFHSHPKGPEHPSETDLAEFAYPGVIMLILSPIHPAVAQAGATLVTEPPGSDCAPAGEWQARAFRIDGGVSPRFTARELPLVRLKGPQGAEPCAG